MDNTTTQNTAQLIAVRPITGSSHICIEAQIGKDVVWLSAKQAQEIADRLKQLVTDSQPSPGQTVSGLLEPQTQLRALMNEKGWTPKAMARSVGVDEQTFNGWLNGTGIPYPLQAKDVADLLGKPARSVWSYELTGRIYG